MVGKVAVVKNSDIKKAVREAVRKIGLPKVKGKKVLIKPNCNSPDKGEMVEPNTIVASKSRVQADITAYKLLNDWGADLPLPPESHPQIAQAIKIGIS